MQIKNFVKLPLALLVAVFSLQSLAQDESESAAPSIVDAFIARAKELSPAPQLIANIQGQEIQSLNGKWNIIVDEHHVGELTGFGSSYYALPTEDPTGMRLQEHAYDGARLINVPGDWNTQDLTLFRYRDVVWYQRFFKAKKKKDERYFIHFDGVNYFSRVFLNGQPIASHKGGYTAFNVEITEQMLTGSNHLVVRVDAKLDSTTVPTAKTSDFFKYGGITRDVNLVTVPKTFIQQYQLYLADLESKTVKGWVQLDGPEAGHQIVSLNISKARIKQQAVTNAEGLATFEFSASRLKLWSPEYPHLYKVSISSAHNEVSDQIGFRTIQTAGKNILLNGEKIYLRGVSLHDESSLKLGVAYDNKDAKSQLDLIKELNGNFARLSHYPHNEYSVRYADKIGLMLWSEIPIVSLIDWSNPETLEAAKTQIHDNISRDRNRAAIVMWSIANESLPQTPERLVFLSALADKARAMDDSNRPLAAALIGDPTQEFAAVTKRLVAEMLNDKKITKNVAAKTQLDAIAKQIFAGKNAAAIRAEEIEIMLEDPLGSVVDIIGYNEYFGWYYAGLLSSFFPTDIASVREKMFSIMKDIRFRNAFGKPLIISEFGAGAKKGYASKFGRGKLWSEEYQAKVYEYQTAMLDQSEFVQGMSPWILKDFRSARRELNGIQDIYNRKGLISEKGEKKKAFYVLKNFYKAKEREKARKR